MASVYDRDAPGMPRGNHAGEAAKIKVFVGKW
jgi:hypothetical protein